MCFGQYTDNNDQPIATYLVPEYNLWNQVSIQRFQIGTTVYDQPSNTRVTNELPSENWS